MVSERSDLAPSFVMIDVIETTQALESPLVMENHQNWGFPETGDGNPIKTRLLAQLMYKISPKKFQGLGGGRVKEEQICSPFSKQN